GHSGNLGTNLLYTGEYFDTDLQQYNLRSRYYDPLNGRFNRADDFAGNNYDPQSLHKYLYCHANPVNGVDPSGMISIGGIVDVVTTFAISMMIRGMELAPKIAALTWAVTKITGVILLTTSIYIGLAEMGWVPDSKAMRILQAISGGAFLVAFMATGLLNAIPKVQGKVPYGSTQLSKQAQAVRISNNMRGGRNIAVFEYKDDSGSLRTIVATSSRGVPGGGHAERIAGRALETMNIPPSRVTQVYSELEPCNNPGGFCSEYIRKTYPQASVSWSFNYADPATRGQGKAEWMEAIDKLFNGWLFKY
ncbi:MAG: hypothetical protein JXA96_10380, partial [Sedimentisphaerales bacterium]|nr:hypothetical protein [Sedimentisphaerales bacterium]